MQPIINYIGNNKEWIFSGVGVFALSGMIWLVCRLLFPNSPGTDKEHRQEVPRTSRRDPSGPLPSAMSEQGGESKGAHNDVPRNWHGILPPQSRFRFVVGTKDSIPLGLQSFSFEYGPQGHANALTLKRTLVRAEIHLTCQIINPYKALFGANEYALNVLLPMFVSQARGILERFSLTRLRTVRLEVARDIMSQLSPHFEELGVRLKSVTIGALDQIELAKRGAAQARAPIQTPLTGNAIRTTDPNDLAFRDVEVKLSDTWDDLMTWLARQMPDCTILSITEDAGQCSFYHSGKPGHIEWPISVVGRREGVPFTQHYDLIRDWLHPAVLRLAPIGEGLPWDTSLFPVKNEEEEETRIAASIAKVTDGVYRVLFAAPKEN
jgi:hypothetical protein